MMLESQLKSLNDPPRVTLLPDGTRVCLDRIASYRPTEGEEIIFLETNGKEMHKWKEVKPTQDLAARRARRDAALKKLDALFGLEIEPAE